MLQLCFCAVGISNNPLTESENCTMLKLLPRFSWEIQRKGRVSMVQKIGHRAKDDSVKIRMDITVDLPAEVANEVERLGLYEFERCSYDEETRRMTASVTTTLYRVRKGA